MTKLLERIQGLPEKKRKTILWIAIAVLAVILLCFLLNNLQNKLKNLDVSEFPELEIPELKIPNIDEKQQ